VDPDVLSLVFAPQRTSQDSLTSRERQIVEGVVRGLRNKEIAREMNLCECTVKMHLHHIFDKLKLESRTQLVLAFSRTEGTEFQLAPACKSSGETHRRQIGRRQHDRLRFNGSTRFDRPG
jgi:DNA-binding CsgD family transcriptional regulator